MAYLFTSERLGFRNWQAEDLQRLAAINADPDVMEFFPGTKSLQETIAFIGRMELLFAEKGYCYFAVDILESGAFAGFIGLCEQTFKADFTPCVDIGWRLSKDFWGKGYATEGAKRCLEFGFRNLHLPKIVAIAPKVNVRSLHIMEKIGMEPAKEFIHPFLANDERLKECVLYEAYNSSFTRPV